MKYINLAQKKFFLNILYILYIIILLNCYTLYNCYTYPICCEMHELNIEFMIFYNLISQTVTKIYNFILSFITVILLKTIIYFISFVYSIVLYICYINTFKSSYEIHNCYIIHNCYTLHSCYRIHIISKITNLP